MSVAKPLAHDAAALHVTGAARYIDDIPCPEGTLHLAFGLSGVACATITGMDLSAVRSAADVVAVISRQRIRTTRRTGLSLLLLFFVNISVQRPKL